MDRPKYPETKYDIEVIMEYRGETLSGLMEELLEAVRKKHPHVKELDPSFVSFQADDDRRLWVSYDVLTEESKKAEEEYDRALKAYYKWRDENPKEADIAFYREAIAAAQKRIDEAEASIRRIEDKYGG